MLNRTATTIDLTAAALGAGEDTLSTAGTYLAALPAAEENGASWMLILPAGKFTPRDGRGPFNTGNKQSLQAIIERTRKYAAGTELMIDYDHQSVNTGTTGGTAKAAGWIKQLEVRDDGIWARVEWTAAAREQIKSGEYRYLSPYFAHDKQGNVALIFNAALLNRPALDLEAVAAGISQTQGKPMDKILKALGLADGTSETAVLAAIGVLTGARVKLASALGLEDDASIEDVIAQAEAGADQRTKLATALGLKVEAGGGELVAAATKLAAANPSGAEPDPAKYVPIADVQALTTQLNSLQADINKGRAETKVDEAIKQGKLIPAQRDWGVALCTKDEKAFDDFIGTAVSLTSSQLKSSTPPSADKVTSLSAEETKVADLLGIDHKVYLTQLQAERSEEAVH